MSDMPSDYRDRLDLRAVIEEIDRNRAETQKLQQETQKFVAEQNKHMAERQKLRSESRKLDRDRATLPWTVAAALLGGGATIFAAGAGFIKLPGG